MTLESLREIREKLGVILRCKLATHNKEISKMPCVSLFQIFLAMFLPSIFGRKLGKLSQKIKRVNIY